MSSQGHAEGVMNFADLQSEHDYDPARAYFQSKLANLLFSYELDRRLRASGAPTISVAAHPGVVYTDLFRTRSKPEQFLMRPIMRPVNFWFMQSVRMGALPVLARPPTRPRAVAISTDPAAAPTPATLHWWSPVPVPTTRTTRRGSGSCRKS